MSKFWSSPIIFLAAFTAFAATSAHSIMLTLPRTKICSILYLGSESGLGVFKATYLALIRKGFPHLVSPTDLKQMMHFRSYFKLATEGPSEKAGFKTGLQLLSNYAQENLSALERDVFQNTVNVDLQELLLEFERQRAIEEDTRRSRLVFPSRAMAFVVVQNQTFMMGSPVTEAGRELNENQRLITISRPFEVMDTPITQGQWVFKMGKNPSHFKGVQYADDEHMNIRGIEMNADHPVEDVTLWSVREYANRLSIEMGLKPAYDFSEIQFTGSAEEGTLNAMSGVLKFNNLENDIYKTEGFRLPTEAEWELMAKAGSETQYPSGDGNQALDQDGWYVENSNNRTHAVGMKQANAWGIYDTSGNIQEWTEDARTNALLGGADPLERGDVVSQRVVRGGSCHASVAYCRSSSRFSIPPGDRRNGVGARLVRTVKP